jgi:hypothetical protein
MDLKELEYKKSDKKTVSTSVPETETSEVDSSTSLKPVATTTRSRADWLLILKLTAALTLVIGILVGLIAGFIVGKVVYENKPGQTVVEGDNTQTEQSIYDKFDYAKMFINKSKNVTIQSFYEDNEERFYAMQLIGSQVPELKYLDKEENELSITSLGEDKYIIEFIEPNCAYCNKMITTIDAYRATENAYKLIGLSIKSGDISKFNEKGENTYMLINKDAKTDELLDLVVWVPTILYVEKGEVKLVTFGLLESAEEIQKNADIAFNRGE